MYRSLVPFFLALPAFAGFAKPVQSVQLQYGQKAVTLTFEAQETIRKAKPHCDCTEVSLQGNRLVAEVDTSQFEGEVEKTIDATTADGKTTRLTMRFSVPPALTLSARSLQWKLGAPATPQTLRISIPAGSPVKNVTQASLSGEDFVYDPRKGKRPGEFYVTITPKSTAKRVMNRLIITTDSPDKRFERFIIYLGVKK